MVKVRQPTSLTNEDIVFQYFRYIEANDLEGLLSLFDYDAVVYEPFSKSTILKGRTSIEPFLKVAIMANTNLKRTIRIEKPASGSGNNNNISAILNEVVVALITFEKGDKVRARFTFELDSQSKKIKSLHIQFL